MLTTYQKYAAVCEVVAAAIKNLILEPANEKEVVELGGVQSLLAAALKHLGTADTIEAIAGALRNLCFRNGTCWPMLCCVVLLLLLSLLLLLLLLLQYPK